MRARRCFIILAAMLALMPAAIAGLTLDSEMARLAGISWSSGDYEAKILDQVTQTMPAGQLDGSVPKKTITAQDGTIITVFVFDFGTSETDFTDLLGYFKEDGYKTLQDKTVSGIRGAELYDGDTRIFLMRKEGTLVEYKVEETFKAAKAEAAAAAGEGWLWILIVAVVAGVFGSVGLLVYYLTRKQGSAKTVAARRKKGGGQ